MRSNGVSPGPVCAPVLYQIGSIARWIDPHPEPGRVAVSFLVILVRKIEDFSNAFCKPEHLSTPPRT